MNNFQYYNPVRIVFGEGQIKELSELVPQDARVLITYGGGSAERTGTLDEVRTASKPTVIAISLSLAALSQTQSSILC